MSRRLPYNLPFGGDVGQPMPYIRAVRWADNPDPVPAEIAADTIMQNAGAIASAYTGLQRLATGTDLGFYSVQRRLSDQVAMQYTNISGQEYVDVVLQPVVTQRRPPKQLEEQIETIPMPNEEHFVFAIYVAPDGVYSDPINEPLELRLNGTSIGRINSGLTGDAQMYVWGTMPVKATSGADVADEISRYAGLSKFVPMVGHDFNLENPDQGPLYIYTPSQIKSYTKIPKRLVGNPGEVNSLVVAALAGFQGLIIERMFFLQTIYDPTTNQMLTVSPKPLRSQSSEFPTLVFTEELLGTEPTQSDGPTQYYLSFLASHIFSETGNVNTDVEFTTYNYVNLPPDLKASAVVTPAMRDIQISSGFR